MKKLVSNQIFRRSDHINDAELFSNSWNRYNKKTKSYFGLSQDIFSMA